MAKDYMLPSKLEETHQYKNSTQGIANYAGGWSRQMLLEREGITIPKLTPRRCLRCSNDFPSYSRGERICKGCKDRS